MTTAAAEDLEQLRLIDRADVYRQVGAPQR
jgi:hypothetical protein